jgi:small-conductance mechanosensitive channel
MSEYLDAFYIPLHKTLLNVISILPRLLIGLLIFGIIYAIANFTRKIANNALTKMPNVHWALRVLIARSIYIVTIIIGVLASLSAIDINVAAVITSLGIAGFAFGFAFKDILENFIAGILLLFARPFEIGDEISSGVFEGTVADIQIRTTTIHTYDNQMIVIPNSQVFTSPVINHSRLGKRRYQVDFDTRISADSNLVQEIVTKIAVDDTDVLNEPAPSVQITKIDTLNNIVSWRLCLWGKPHKAEELLITSKILRGLKLSLFDSGIAIPEPPVAPPISAAQNGV